LNTAKNKRKFTNSMGFQMISWSLAVFVLFSIVVLIIEIFVYSSYANQNSTTQNTVLTEQVLYNYEKYFENISTISNQIQDCVYSNDDLVSDNEEKKEDGQFFDNIISIKREINSIRVYSLSTGSLLAKDSQSINDSVDVNNPDEWFTSAKTNTLIDNFSAVTYSGESYHIVLSRYAESNKGQLDCIVRMDLDFTSIVNSIYEVDFGTGGHIIIYDKNYSLVYTSSNEYSDSEKALLKENVLGTKSVTIDKHDFVLTQYTISHTTWRVALFSNVDAVRATNTTFIIITAIVCLASCVAFSFILVLLASTVTRPLNDLQEAMDAVRDSDYLKYVPTKIKGSNEVEELNESYDGMMKQIKKLMSNVVEEQNNQRKSEFKALTNQINPHFLYNTLDSIIYLIDEGKNEDAQTMVLALSKFFRISISKGKTIIPLRDEIEHIKNYLIIQKMRYKDSFSYQIEAEPLCLDFQVIKLILQPIVENAIYHGLHEKESGIIRVICYQEGDFLKLSVKDNGLGITQNKIDEIRQSFDDPEVYNGVGLKNVYQRLKIYYGPKADVLIESVLDEGTTITLVIPLRGGLNDQK